jgi:hypothetical protein
MSPMTEESELNMAISVINAMTPMERPAIP